MKEAMFYSKGDNRTVVCDLCPHRCTIPDQKTGLCMVRKNMNGILYSLNYELVSSIAIDPMEKKPLHRFKPKTEILSFGSFGCNFHCGFCQNYEISKEFNLSLQEFFEEIEDEEITDLDQVSTLDKRHNRLKMEAKKIIDEAKVHDIDSIAYTYNEPTVFYEMVYETAKLAKEAGLDNVLVTNGYINEEPLLNLLPYIDAMNIDVKGYDSERCYEVSGGYLEPVIHTIKKSIEQGVHVEITCLIVPDFNDDVDAWDAFFKELKEQIGDVYVHISRYFPRYHYQQAATDINLLLQIKERCKKYFTEVSLGNVR